MLTYSFKKTSHSAGVPPAAPVSARRDDGPDGLTNSATAQNRLSLRSEILTATGGGSAPYVPPEHAPYRAASMPAILLFHPFPLRNDETKTTTRNPFRREGGKKE